MTRTYRLQPIAIDPNNPDHVAFLAEASKRRERRVNTTRHGKPRTFYREMLKTLSSTIANGHDTWRPNRGSWGDDDA